MPKFDLISTQATRNFLKSLHLANPLIVNPTKCSNTLKQFVGKLPTNCLSVFNYFAGFALKRLTQISQKHFGTLKIDN